MARNVARGFSFYKREANLKELFRLEAEAAAAEGRCRAKMNREVYESIKDEEQAVYRDPHERLDFWRGVETSIEERIRLQLATGLCCPECGSDDVTTEQTYRSPWITVTCNGCGEMSEVDAAPRNEAAVRY